MVTKISRSALPILAISLLVACSSNNGSDSEDTMDGGDTNGMGNSNGDGDPIASICTPDASATDSGALSLIASQAAEAQPLSIDIAALQADLQNLPNACLEAQPIPVNTGASALDVLNSLQAGS